MSGGTCNAIIENDKNSHFQKSGPGQWFKKVYITRGSGNDPCDAFWNEFCKDNGKPDGCEAKVKATVVVNKPPPEKKTTPDERYRHEEALQGRITPIVPPQERNTPQQRYIVPIVRVTPPSHQRPKVPKPVTPSQNQMLRPPPRGFRLPPQERNAPPHQRPTQQGVTPPKRNRPNETRFEYGTPSQENCKEYLTAHDLKSLRTQIKRASIGIDDRIQTLNGKKQDAKVIHEIKFLEQEQVYLEALFVYIRSAMEIWLPQTQEQLNYRVKIHTKQFLDIMKEGKMWDALRKGGIECRNNVKQTIVNVHQNTMNEYNRKTKLQSGLNQEDLN